MEVIYYFQQREGIPNPFQCFIETVKLFTEIGHKSLEHAFQLKCVLTQFDILLYCFIFSSSRRMHSKFRDGSARPVYGRVMIKPAAGRFQESPSSVDRPRYDDYRPLSNFESGFLANHKQPTPDLAQSRRRQMKVRFGNGASGTNVINPASSPTPHAIFGSPSSNVNQNQITPQRGSFQRLKQLVWTERARELEDQRRKEAVAARAAILKDITNGQQ